MATRLREDNSLDIAAAWLSEQDDDLAGYQAEDILEDARLGKIELGAVVPEWQRTGEIDWLRLDRVVDVASGSYTYKASAASNFLASDGRIRVTAEMAKRLLEHGECSLDCVRMPIIDCSKGGELPTDSWLQGIRDGRLIEMEHIRVTRDQLLSFASMAPKPITPSIKEKIRLLGVSKADMLAAPWQFVHGYDEKKFGRDLGDPPAWLSDDAMITRGRKGGPSAMWNPAVVATIMCLRNKFVPRIAARVINDHFPDYIDTWKSHND